VLTQVVEKVASTDVLKEKVNSEFILENVIHAQNKRAFGLEKNISLSSSVDNLSFLNEHILIDPLHGVELSISRVNN
jgi:hypothetical protein